MTSDGNWLQPPVSKWQTTNRWGPADTLSLSLRTDSIYGWPREIGQLREKPAGESGRFLDDVNDIRLSERPLRVSLHLPHSQRVDQAVSPSS